VDPPKIIYRDIKFHCFAGLGPGGLNMKDWKLKKNEEAVSPVIAVILMVAITVVLAAVLYTWALSFIRNDKQTPTIGATYVPVGNNDFQVNIEKVDPNPVSVISVNYYLLDDKGTAVPGVQGSVKDIYGLNFNDPNTNISFQDNDRDGKISAGDVFLVKNANNGGQAQSAYSLLLKFAITGDKMNGGGTTLGQ